MQYDDGKISPKFVVFSSLFLGGLVAFAAMSAPTQADSGSIVATPVAKVTTVTEVAPITTGPISTQEGIVEEPIQEEGFQEVLVIEDPVVSLEATQEKSDKTGLTHEVAELSKELHYNPDDITQPSQMTLEQLESFTQKYCPCWVGLEEHLLTLDDELNLIFLLSVGRMETWAGSECVGDYNSFNIRYNSGGYVDYASYKDSIDDFVRLITEEYLDPDGLWHEGVSIESVSVHYAESTRWADGITDLGYEIYEYML